MDFGGTWVAQSVKYLPLSWLMIPGSWDQVPHRAPCSAGSLSLPLHLPAAPPACSLSLSQINKILKKKLQKAEEDKNRKKEQRHEVENNHNYGRY